MIEFIFIAGLYINVNFIVALKDVDWRGNKCEVVVVNTSPGWNSTTTGHYTKETCQEIKKLIGAK